MKIKCNLHGGLLIACILLACDLSTPPPPRPPNHPQICIRLQIKHCLVLSSLYYVFSGKEGMIHLFTRSHVKKPVLIGLDTICLTKVCSDWLKIDVTKTRTGSSVSFLCFVPIFYFLVPRAVSLFPVFVTSFKDQISGPTGLHGV